MLYAFLGTDRKKSRDAMNAAIKKSGKGERVHITDAHSPEDLEASLGGGGMFLGARTVILDGILGSEALRPHLLQNLPHLAESSDSFFIFEEKIDAATKRSLAKYAEKVETFDAAKGKPDNAIFKLRFALERGDKKALWVGLMHEIASGKAPEAVHGFLFWAAKQIALASRSESAASRGKRLVARLAELPHESRRKGMELEYALERFVLSEV